MADYFMNPIFWLVVAAACVDIYHNARIIYYYSAMARLTSRSIAVTRESKEGFSEFFSLCGWGTHGMHILHIPAEIAAVVLLVDMPTSLVPLLLFLMGAAVIHWKQADAAEAVLDNFFERDLRIIANLFGSQESLEQKKKELQLKEAEELMKKYRKKYYEEDI